MPLLRTQVPRERREPRPGIEARKAAHYRDRMDPAAQILLQDCRADPEGRDLTTTVNLHTLRKLVTHRTQIECKRYQYRSRVGLVEFLMRWFPTKQRLLEALAFAISSGELPPDFGHAPSSDTIPAHFDPWDKDKGSDSDHDNTFLLTYE